MRLFCALYTARGARQGAPRYDGPIPMNAEPKREPSLEKDVELSFEAPARVLEESVEAVARGEHALISKKPFKLAEEYWSTLGPGLVTGLADNDPSGITTYSQAGARFGLQLIWMPLFTYPFLSVVQEMCARIGVVTGRGLAANIRAHAPRRALYLVTALLFAANAFNVGADLGAMSTAARLILPSVGVPVFVIIFALISLALQIFTTYARYARYLKYMGLALLSYVVVAFSVHLDWGAVLSHTLVPHMTFTKDHIFLLAAVLGTTISPYLFFWQTSLEVEEEILRGDKTLTARRHDVSPKLLGRMRVDVWSGMLFSNLVAFFIFAACAGTLFSTAGGAGIQTAADAAAALGQTFGSSATWLFAIGVIGAGLLSVPVLAGSAAYAISESFGWKYGLYRKLKQAYAFYGVIITAMAIGIVANLMHLDPIKALISVAVANGVIAPFIIYFILRISSDKKIMGEHANGPLIKAAGWTTLVLMAFSGIGAILTLFL